MQFKIKRCKNLIYMKDFGRKKKPDDKIWSRTLRDSSTLHSSLFWYFMRQHQCLAISAISFSLDNFCGMERRDALYGQLSIAFGKTLLRLYPGEDTPV